MNEELQRALAEVVQQVSAAGEQLPIAVQEVVARAVLLNGIGVVCGLVLLAVAVVGLIVWLAREAEAALYVMVFAGIIGGFMVAVMGSEFISAYYFPHAYALDYVQRFL